MRFSSSVMQFGSFRKSVTCFGSTCTRSSRNSASLSIRSKRLETLSSIKAVKAFGREGYEAKLYADENWAALLAERKARLLLLIYRLLSNFLRGLAYIAVVYIGAREVVSGHGGGLTGAALSLGL